MQQPTRLRVDELVTVTPIESDPYILNFQRHARIARVDAWGRYWLRLEATLPPWKEFGPIPSERLQRGWRDNRGRWL